MIAPDSFKGSLSATGAAAAMAEGCRRADPGAEIDLCPVSDGGEGFVEAMHAAGEQSGAVLHTVKVTGPLGDPVAARWAELPGGTAAIAMSEAAGLGQVSEDRRDPTRTTTRGVGELVALALDAGCRRVLVGLGGSATCDGGLGMAMALGVRLLDEAGRELAAVPVDVALAGVARIKRSDLDPRLGETEVAAACDVTRPADGASGGGSGVTGRRRGRRPSRSSGWTGG